MTPSPPNAHPEWRYTATEAARLLGISRRTFSRWAAAGKIKPRLSKATMQPRYLGRDLIRLWQSEV